MTRAAIFPGTLYRRMTSAADVARGTNVIRLAPEVFLPALLLHGLHTTPPQDRIPNEEITYLRPGPVRGSGGGMKNRLRSQEPERSSRPDTGHVEGVSARLHPCCLGEERTLNRLPRHRAAPGSRERRAALRKSPRSPSPLGGWECHVFPNML